MNLHLRFVLFSLLFLLNCSLFGQSLRDKIGQMLMVGFYQYDSYYDTLLVDISENNLGGVILFKYNIQNPVQIQELTTELQQYATTPLFIATDQEGGYVARLNSSNGFESTYTAFQLGSVFDSEDSTRMQSAKMAGWLKSSGINVNLAPVADVNVNPNSPAIGYWERSFSGNPYKVAQHSGWFFEEFSVRNILSVLKHFPGHGSALQDSHLGLPDITSTWADSELIPYQVLIQNGFSDIVMTGHLYNANIDSLYPSSLSYKTITSLLRDSLNFGGMIISDEMFMQAIRNNYSFNEAVMLAINAGTDVLLYSTNEYNNMSLVKYFTDNVEFMVSNGDIAFARIEESYQRIMNLKSHLTTVDEPIAQNLLPNNFLLSNFPNPFNSSTLITINAPYTTFADIRIYNITGKLVRQIKKLKLSSGTNQFKFDASTLASGIYVVSLSVNKFTFSRKITLIK